MNKIIAKLSSTPTISLQELAKEVDILLKINSTGTVVNMFRSNNKIDVLKETMPFLHKGNQMTIEAVLNKTVAGKYC